MIKCSESENTALHSRLDGVDTAGLFALGVGKWGCARLYISVIGFL